MANILIKDAVIVPMYELSGKKYFRGALGVEGNLIAMIDTDGSGERDFREKHEYDLTEIDGSGMAVMPGLVNTHCHTPMTLLRSYADDLPLMPWLKEHVWPFEARMTENDIVLGAELGIAEMLLGGTTCFLDMYFHETAIAEVVERMGIRAVLSPSLMDGNREGFERDFKELARRYPAGNPGRITAMAAAHSPYTCTRQDLVYIKDLAEEYGVGVNIHIAETIEEMEIIRERTGTSPVKYLDSLGLLNSSTVAVHCVHLDDEDIEIFRKRGVSVSHNPQSNMKLASGVSPVAKMLGTGINVAIGTDGASSNNDLDMWEEMRSASFLQKVTTMDPCVLPAWETLKMATVNGAQAIGLGDRIGQLKEGMVADIIMVDMHKPHLQPPTDVIANLAYCAKAGDVDTVIIDGSIVVQSGKLAGIDLPEIYRRSAERVAEITTEVDKSHKQNH